MALLAWMQGKKLVFVTNNSTKSRAGYLKKFTGLGLNVSAVCCLGSGKGYKEFESWTGWAGQTVRGRNDILDQPAFNVGINPIAGNRKDQPLHIVSFYLPSLTSYVILFFFEI